MELLNCPFCACSDLATFSELYPLTSVKDLYCLRRLPSTRTLGANRRTSRKSMELSNQMELIKTWIKSPVRMFRLRILNRCPDCKCKSIAWGQWNDGQWAGKPICCNPECPNPSPYSEHNK